MDTAVPIGRWDDCEDLPSGVEIVRARVPYWEVVERAISLQPSLVGPFASGDYSRLCRTPVFTKVTDRDGNAIDLHFKVKRLANGRRLHGWQSGYGRVSSARAASLTAEEERLGIESVKDGFSPRDQVARSLNYAILHRNAFRYYADWGLSGGLGTSDEHIMRNMVIRKLLTYIDAIEKVFLSEYVVGVYTPEQQNAIRAHIESTVRDEIRRLSSVVDFKTLTGKIEQYCPEVVVRRDGKKQDALAFRPGVTLLLQDLRQTFALTLNEMNRLARSVSLTQVITEEIALNAVQYVAFIEATDLSNMGGQVVTDILARIAEHKLFEAVSGVIRGTLAMLEAGRCLGSGNIPFWISRDKYGRAEFNGNKQYADLMLELVQRDGAQYRGWNRIREELHAAGLRSRSKRVRARVADDDESDSTPYVTDLEGEYDAIASLSSDPEPEPDAIPVPNGKGKPSISTGLVQYSVSNPALYGSAYYCGLEFPNIYPPVMTREEFDRLQIQLGTRAARKQASADRPQGRPPTGHMLLGVFECVCGLAMGKKTGKKLRLPLMCGVATGQQTGGDMDTWHPTLYWDDAAEFLNNLLRSRDFRQPLLARLADHDSERKIRTRLAEIDSDLQEIKESTLAAQARATREAQEFLRAIGEEDDPISLENQRAVYLRRAMRGIDAGLQRRLEAEHGGLLLQLSLDAQDHIRTIDERCTAWDSLTEMERNEIIRSIFLPLRIVGPQGQESIQVKLKRLDDNLLPPIHVICKPAGAGKWSRRLPTVESWIDSMIDSIPYEQE